MKNFLKRNSVIALAFCFVLAATEPAFPLSCDAPSIQRNYENSDWVFLAEVLEARDTYSVNDPWDHRSLQKLKLNVLNVWKGLVPENIELEIYTTKGRLVYGRPKALEEKQKYIFNLSGKQTLAPHGFPVSCDYPWPVSKAEKEIIWLNSIAGELP